MAKSIVIIGTLDTKGEEVGYLEERIAKRGHDPIVIDCGILGEPSFLPDVTRMDVAKTAGMSLDEIIALGDEARAMKVMAEAAAKIVGDLYSDGKLDGILAIGGSMGTSAGLTAMRALPLGVPKLLVSTMALPPSVRADIVSMDITIMPSLADIWGLNRITNLVLDHASGAISGMVENHRIEEPPEASMVAVTTLGTAACTFPLWLKPLLEQRGYEVVVFHEPSLMAMRTLKYLVEHEQIAGVLCLTTFDLACNLCTGNAWSGNAGLAAMEVAVQRGIPLVVGPGCIDFFVWIGTKETLPPRMKNRKQHEHNPLVLAVMTSVKEKTTVADTIAQRLNEARAPAAVIIPEQGFSDWDKEGGLFYDARGRKAFARTLKGSLKPEVRVLEVDAHINDQRFAEEVARLTDEIIGRNGR